MSNQKPTILAFHGSGCNATIHTVQIARLSRLLNPHFNIRHIEGPFPSAAGPGVLPFFDGCGPFKRWIPPSDAARIAREGVEKEKGTAHSAGTFMAEEVVALIVQEVGKVRALGGKVVGVLGFSQGTRVVAGLLRAAEIRREIIAERKIQGGDDMDWLSDIEFGLSICGSYPPILLPGGFLKSQDLKVESGEELVERGKKKIQLPCLHAQGRQDEWEWAGRLLIDGCYEVGEGKSLVLELEMGHFYPTKVEDNERIRDWALETYNRTCL